jgi:hypothetical protein
LVKKNPFFCPLSLSFYLSFSLSFYLSFYLSFIFDLDFDFYYLILAIKLPFGLCTENLEGFK